MIPISESKSRVTLAATIPTAQYANLQPSFECEGDTHEEAMELALQRMKALWDRVAQKPLEIGGEETKSEPRTGELKRCWASGTEIWFDPVEHTYRDADGVKYMGGSTFAHRFTPEFPAEVISGKMASKYGVQAADIRAMWELNAHASSTFGTSLHAALELYGRYGDLSKTVKDGSVESALTKNPTLRPIVEKFYEGRESETAEYECLVADPVRHHAGLIDRLLVESDGLTTSDFKSNTDIHKPVKVLPPFTDIIPNTLLGIFWIQLSYYSRILQCHGQTVKGLRVHHWDGVEWTDYDHPVLDLDEIMRQK